MTPPVHRYATSGRYNVTLRVTDDRGGAATLVRQITVSRVNTPPVAIFTASTAGLSLNVDATPSSDVDGVAELAPEARPGFRAFGYGEELGELLGQKVDFNTPAMLSKHFREEVLREAVTLYEQA